MIPNVDESVLISEFHLRSSSAPKPEAPWIKRCDFGIKFTDEIQVLDNPDITETEESTQQFNDDESKHKGHNNNDEDSDNN
jgi:hypothetical protein